MGSSISNKGDLFILTFYILLICECSEVPRPRGVSISRASLYAPGKDFTCFDGSLTIPFSQVNDDYCDCFDGSDEPGTSACFNGVFHCTNAGHRPENIPSSRVNDGICDCCDASDEYAHPSANCINNCNDLGREARLEAQRRSELVKAGSQLRSEIIQRGGLLKSEMSSRIDELEKNKSEAELLKAEKQRIKEDAELLENSALKQYRDAEEVERLAKETEQAAANRVEAEETFKKFDSDQNGLISIADLQTRSTFDKDRNGEVSEQEARFFLAENSELPLEDFVDKAWPLIKPYLMIEGGSFKPPVSETADMTGEEPEIEETEGDHPEDGDAEEGQGEEEETEESEEHEQSEEQEPEEHHEPEPHYDEETQQLVNSASEARNQFNQAEKAVRDIEVEIEKIKESLGKDYGPQEEFATLVGQCFDFTDREYVYRLCPFDRATQQPKSGGSETRLGNWGEWVGPPENKYSIMLYSQGTACWNGPNRSAKIIIDCGLDTAVTSVSEPNRCEYVFEMHTPAACVEINDENIQKSAHDEL